MGKAMTDERMASIRNQWMPDEDGAYNGAIPELIAEVDRLREDNKTLCEQVGFLHGVEAALQFCRRWAMEAPDGFMRKKIIGKVDKKLESGKDEK